MVGQSPCWEGLGREQVKEVLEIIWTLVPIQIVRKDGLSTAGVLGDGWRTVLSFLVTVLLL